MAKLLGLNLRQEELVTEIPWPRHNTTYNVLIAVMHEGPRCDDHVVFTQHPHPDLRELFSQESIQCALGNAALPLASGFYWLTLLFTDYYVPWNSEDYEYHLTLTRCVRSRDLTIEEACDYRLLDNNYKRVGGTLVWDNS